MFSKRDKISFQRKISCPSLREASQSDILCHMERTEELTDQMEITPNYKTQQPLKKARKVLIAWIYLSNKIYLSHKSWNSTNYFQCYSAEIIVNKSRNKGARLGQDIEKRKHEGEVGTPTPA